MAEESTVHEGGCLCGAVRYQVRGAPLAANWCHCRLCQRSSGAPALAWVTFPRQAFQLLSGTPAGFRSSPKAIRSFCPVCGTQLFFEVVEDATQIDVTTASLEDPNAFPPDSRIWTESRLAWDGDADLPAYAGEGL